MGEVSYRQVNPVLSVKNTLRVGECVEAVPSVIGTHTAFTNAAKSHSINGNVHKGIVYTATTKTATLNYAVNRLFVG